MPKFRYWILVSGQLPPREIVPRSGFGLGLGLVLGLSGNCPRALDFVFLNQYYQITKKSVGKSQFYIHHASYLNFILEYSLWWIQQLYHVWENPFTGSLEIESHKTIGENVVRSFLNWSTKTFPSLLGDFTAAIFASIEWKWA